MTNTYCPKCHGEMDEGKIDAGENLRYVSNRQTGAFRSPTPIRKACVCLNCGYIELFLDAAELKKKIQR